MKLHYGSPPIDPSFHPREEGWTPLREPSPLMLNFVATPVGFLLGGLVLVAWDSRAMVSSGENAIPIETQLTIAGLCFFVGLPLLIAVHEVIHGLTFPGFGTKSPVYLAVWPSKLLFYAHTTGVISRNRMLAVFAMPTVVLTLLPLALDRLFGLQSWPLALIAVTNALMAGGDATCVALVLAQIPWSANVRNEGWATWWKLPEEKTAATPAE